MVLKISLAESLLAQPPFSSLFHWAEDGALNLRLVFENYAYLWEDELYVDTYFNSIKIAAVSTLLCLLIGYPIAFGIVRSNPPTRNILLLLVILPFWTSFLLRIYAWMGLLADQGTINNILIALGIIDEPIRLLYTELAVYIGIIYTYLPFMILPLYANMEKLDMTLHEAAADLGSRPATSFFTITLPLTLPGIIAGSLLVFIPATGEFVIPDLLGGGNVLMIGRVLYSELSRGRNPMRQPGKSTFLFSMLCFGMAFLYVPMILLVLYSFNHSKLVPVWGGFSTRWYRVLFESEEVWSAAYLSLKIAVMNATFATLLGTFAGIALVRFGQFRGRTLFSAMIAAPLVMPEVITGLSLLLLFITLGQLIGWPAERGITTITIAHITFSMAYVAIIIQARLTGVSQDFEEAAQDLGAKPFRVLTDITLPLLAPGMLSGWLLSFTLSLDDLVIATFTSGPGANTLPMLIFSRIRLGLRPDINALATIIIVIVAICVFLAGWLMLRQQRQRLRDLQQNRD